MTKAKLILVAVGAITGGIRAGKDTAFRPATLGDGEELTEKAAAELGLDDAAIAQLRERGALIGVSARLAEAGDAGGADRSGALAAAERRASELESANAQLAEKVTTLEAELDAAKKAAAKA